MYNCFCLFLFLIDLSFEKMPRKFVELQKKNASYLQMIGMFWSMLQSENENISFLYSVWLKKKRLFQKYKAMDIFLYYKNALKKLKKETEKNDDSGVGFCNKGGTERKKILSNWGIFFLLFLLHTYTVITV